jgi:hypothetical protein
MKFTLIDALLQDYVKETSIIAFIEIFLYNITRIF